MIKGLMEEKVGKVDFNDFNREDKMIESVEWIGWLAKHHKRKYGIGIGILVLVILCILCGYKELMNSQASKISTTERVANRRIVENYNFTLQGKITVEKQYVDGIEYYYYTLDNVTRKIHGCNACVIFIKEGKMEYMKVNKRSVEIHDDFNNKNLCLRQTESITFYIHKQ